MKTDMQLQQDVLAELQWEPSILASGIGVEVKDGVVTLAGHVRSYPEKWEAERAAQRVAGVKAMAVDLTVSIPESDAKDDADIAHAAANVLKWMSFLPKDAVKVLVEDGWIELTGDLEWNFQRKGIEDGMRHLAGVKGINDYITVKPGVSSKDVKAQIEGALRRRAMADANNISVGVSGEEVTLSGRVQSWEERAMAHNSAWGTAGVGSLIDHIVVSG